MKRSCLGTLDHFGADIGALDSNVPGRQLGKMLEDEHGQAISLLAGGAGCAPEAQAACHAALFNQFGQQLGPQQVEGAAIAKEAGFVNRHCLGDGARENGISAGAQVAHQFVQARHSLVAQQLGEAGFKEVIARRVEDVLREAEDELAKIAVVDAGRGFHD